MLASEGRAERTAAPATVLAALRAVRPHQWSKNVLLFAPVLAAHRFDALTLVAAVRAFVAFSLCASSAYLVNDLLDAESDRRHPTKRRRPFASGALPAWAGWAGAPALLAAAAVMAWPLPAGFHLLLAGYLAVTLAYSVALKKVAVLDVIVLAGLYVARVFAGSLATGVAVSDWLLTFAMFLFLSLALVKRTSELRRVGEDIATQRRGYGAADEQQLASLGAAAGYLAVLVLALYVRSGDVVHLYAEPRYLWLLCPLLLYWVSRVWLLARRGLVHCDPVEFALKDPASHGLAALAAAVIWLASRP